MDQGLYAIVDADALGARPLVPFAERVLAAGRLSALQLRAKRWGAGALLACARELAPRCRDAGVPFFVNDRPDVAWLAGAAGVHVGMDDLPVAEVRRVAPGLWVGASSHDPEEVTAVLGSDTNYLAFGPVFGTRSKDRPAPTVGTDALRAVVARANAEGKGRPVVAIGGITLENAGLVRASGARAGAVIAALVVDDASVTSVARALHVALGGD